VPLSESTPLLVSSKLIIIQVPFLFKNIVNQLNTPKQIRPLSALLWFHDPSLAHGIAIQNQTGTIFVASIRFYVLHLEGYRAWSRATKSL
jgi:hypothetical protein